MAIATQCSQQEQKTGERLAALRAAMATHALDAYLIPSVDEHINEYLPENKQRRAWISGFTGSAGDALVCTDEAWVFADSRYHEQADFEVALNHIHVSKLGLEGQPSLTEKIRELAEKASQQPSEQASEQASRPTISGHASTQTRSFRLGFDPFTLTVQQAQGLQHALESAGGVLVPVSGNLIDPLWSDAPPTPCKAVFSLPETITGASTHDKLTAVRERMSRLKVDVLPLTKLDQIAWLFNLRGQDIPYNPVFIAYALVTNGGSSGAQHGSETQHDAKPEAHLFTDAIRIQNGALDSLQGHVTLHPYEDYASVLQALSKNTRVLVDPKHTTFGTRTLIEQSHGHIQEAEHPVELLKALKNATEIQGMREANLKASRGKIRAWYWLEQQLAAGKTVTEASFRDAIEAFYAEEEGFKGLSFNTIAGAGANGSIVHYGTPDPQKRLESGELFLIDSGCQFQNEDFMGTTDDTRTVLVGNVATELQTLRFTEVLKAHINCAMQKFPKGTEGARLDGITRFTLWQNGLDYGHGTGHGVGAFMNVHEGPNGIHRMASKPLEPGMINSIEPGYYEPGWGGIRLENLYCVAHLEVEDLETGASNHPKNHPSSNQSPNNRTWYGFENLTFIPFDKKLIDLNRLSPEQRRWLEDYHQAIVDKIAPSLSPEEAQWLTAICRL